MRQSFFKLIKFIIGWPLSIAAIVFLARIMYTQTNHISFQNIHINGWLLSLSILAFLFYFLFRGIFWKYLLSAKGHILFLKETTFLWSFSELQRYIPGNIWAIIKRSVTFEKKGIDKKTTALLWLNEAQFLCIGAIVVSLLAFNFIFYGMSPHFSNKHIVAFILSLLTYAGVAIFIFQGNIPKKSLILKHLLPSFSITTTLQLLFFMTAAFCFFGVGTYLSIVSFTPLYPHDFTTFVGFFVFSFLVGYLSFIFPMGLGPREGIMIYGLSKYIALPTAIIGTFFSRILLIIAEILFVILSSAWYTIPQKKLQQLNNFVSSHKYFLITLLFITVYVTYFTTASFYRYTNFFAGRFDLGNMDQTVWNTVHGRIFQLTDPDGTNIISRLSVHADFILVLLAPFYLLWQDPRMLLLIQTLVLGAGAIFVYLLGKEITKSQRISCVFAILFLLSPYVEFSNLYDFHAVTLATTLFLGAFYFLKRNNTLFTLIFLFLAGTTKEEAWAVVAIFGFYAFVIEKRKIFGSVLFVLGSVLFYAMFKIIPIVKGGQHFAAQFYSDFGNSPSSIIKTMIFSPQKTFVTVFQKTKLSYLFELGFPLAFLSLFAPIFLIFMAPDLAVNLLSNNKAFHEIYYQYTAVLSAFIFIAALYGFVQVRKKFPIFTEKKLLGIVLLTGIIGAYNYGPLPIAKNPSVDMFWLQQHDKDAMNDFLNSIPRRYSIAASNNVGSHLSHRQLIYTIPNGIDKADILVFLLNDRFAQPSLPAQIQMTEKLRKDPRYVETMHLGDFVVFEKKSIYPHMKARNRPNSLIPTIIQNLQQGFNNRGTSNTFKSS